MKKTIELNLNLNDPFFGELKERVLHMNGISGFDEYIYSIISPVMSATLKTLRDLSSKQKQTPNKLIKFSYEHKENVYPDFHNLLDNNIDTALNRRIHTTTLERITDIIEDFMDEYADTQKEKKKLKEQNKIKANPLVDSDKELVAITHYISTTWNGFSDETSPEFFKKVWNNCNHLLRNNFDQYVFLDFMKELYELKDLHSVKVNGLNSKDLPMYFMISKSSLNDALRKDWDYEKNVHAIIADVKSEFPYASKARPKNWTKLAKNYVDFDGMDELNSLELHKLFTGMNSGTAGAPSFEVRTSLPHVMYDDKCQGRKPLEVLVGAMLGHSYVMNEKNNGSKMLKEWIELKEQMEDNPGQDITFDFKEPLNQALFHIMRNEGEVKPGALRLLGITVNTKKLKV